jgi:hypothetical protein
VFFFNWRNFAKSEIEIKTRKWSDFEGFQSQKGKDLKNC